ncbi:hypothetical protein GALMADRAFT_1155674 [Galerina marginata CBS 339.88]|uniref:Uncharacterized protein n=1 Tax=Galerina marginata (strain CBS 339.88) TaxID=685588 RepID=A0A067S6T6_GALM3|nr:hypothetical protein GALMADRAFT_1155674 [Galerina marginata CBS 339.88]
MSVLVVDEQAMPVVTRLNAPKRRRQNVSTMSNHLAICGFNQMDEKDTPRRPVTMNWRDSRATINQRTASSKKAADELSEYESEEEDDDNALASPADPGDDPLKWLDDGFPDLFGFECFDLATQFDIARYVQILADGV